MPKILQDTQISGSELQYEVCRAYVLMVEEGVSCKREMPFSPDDQILYIKGSNGEMAALMCWNICETTRNIVITIGYVHIQYRGLGYYTLLFKKLSSIRDKKYKKYKICGGVLPVNKKMQKMCKKLNRVPAGVWYVS